MTEQNKHINESQLLNFLLGELTDKEMKEVSDWLLLSDQNQEELDQLEAIWAEAGKLIPTPVAVDTPFAWSAMSDRIDEFESNNKSEEKVIPLFKKKTIRFLSSIAAILIISFGIFQLVMFNSSAKMLELASTNNVVYESLPDGSQIALNLNAKIEYPKKFNRKVREVNLEGEAFFSVAHNPKQPFIINTGDAKIKVLGTKFTVNTNDNSGVNVAVTSGSVLLFKVDSISGDTSSVILKGGQQGILPKGKNQPEIVNEPLFPDDLFWMKRTLDFRQSKLSEVITVLEKNYRVKIKIENPKVYNCTYTASFKDSDIVEILDMLLASFDFELLKQGNTYILRGHGCLEN